MTGTAIEPDEDAGPGFCLRRLQPLPLGKRDPKKGERSQLQSMAAGDTVTARLWHESSPLEHVLIDSTPEDELAIIIPHDRIRSNPNFLEFLRRLAKRSNQHVVVRKG